MEVLEQSRVWSYRAPKTNTSANPVEAVFKPYWLHLVEYSCTAPCLHRGCPFVDSQTLLVCFKTTNPVGGWGPATAMVAGIELGVSFGRLRHGVPASRLVGGRRDRCLSSGDSNAFALIFVQGGLGARARVPNETRLEQRVCCGPPCLSHPCKPLDWSKGFCTVKTSH